MLVKRVEKIIAHLLRGEEGGQPRECKRESLMKAINIEYICESEIRKKEWGWLSCIME